MDFHFLPVNFEDSNHLLNTWQTSEFASKIEENRGDKPEQVKKHEQCKVYIVHAF